MNVKEYFNRTVMMMERQLQGEDSFIYYRLINYYSIICNNECINHLALSLSCQYTAYHVDHGCQKRDGGCHKMVRW